MKCSHIKEILKDAEYQIRELDNQIFKAKQKLQMLKYRKNILYAKLTLMKKAILEVQIKKSVANMKQSNEVEQDLSNMLGNMLSLQNETPAMPHLNTSESGYESVAYTALQPYIHQVGGHSSMLCLDEKRVCKPVIERELEFYRSIPNGLKPYTPDFFGVVEVNVIFEGDYMCLVTSQGEELTKQNSRSGRLRLRRTGSVEVLPTKCQFEDDITNGKNGTTGMNPWVLKCHRDHLAALVKAIDTSKKPQNFLVLENLTSSLRFPCILDLKMGTRQYDERDNLAKRQSKMFKVVNTTTGKLGLRIAGMQVYQITTGRFLCRNKLYGRALTPAGFSLAMRQFLHDGVRLRTELLSPFIRKLEGLAETLGEQNCLRLYTTSLLLIYEGDSTTLIQTHDRLREKRESIIRSRGLSLDEELIDLDSDGMGRSTSAESITSLLEGVSEVRATRYHGRRRSSSCAGQPRSSSDFGLCDQAEEEPFTDVRVIDFAHSSHAGMEECATSNGPDEGFLFGLDNIIAILKGIEREYRRESLKTYETCLEPVLFRFSG